MLYERKQQELCEAGVHLVEVDFIRRGPHVLEIPETVVEEFRPWDYLVNLARRGSGEYEFYPLRLRERLPRIRVPLKPGTKTLYSTCRRSLTARMKSAPIPNGSTTPPARRRR